MWQVRTTITMLTALAAATSALAIPVSVQLQPRNEPTIAVRGTEVPAMHLSPRWDRALIQARGFGGEPHLPEASTAAHGSSTTAHSPEGSPKHHAAAGSPTPHASKEPQEESKEPWKGVKAYTLCAMTLTGCFKRQVELADHPSFFTTQEAADAHRSSPVKETETSCKLAPFSQGCFKWNRYSWKKTPDTPKSTDHAGAPVDKLGWPELYGPAVGLDVYRGRGPHIKSTTTCGPAVTPRWAPGCFGVHAKYTGSEPSSPVMPSSPVKPKTAQE